MNFSSFWQMFTTTLGSACVIAAVATVFYSSEKRSELHKNHKTVHRIIVAILFGLLSIYASESAVQVDGALCNCRNLAPLYAGLVGGPIPGVGAALIGGLYRYIRFGGASALPCMLACFAAGIIGAVLHIVIRKIRRYDMITGLCGSVITEGLHMLLLCLFDQTEIAQKIWLPILLANLFGMAFCLYMYKRCHPEKKAEVAAQ